MAKNKMTYSEERRARLKAPRIMWCPTCQAYRKPMPHNTCPECGLISTTIRCTRCGFEWTPREGCDPGPSQCYNCHNIYYDRPKVKK